VFSVDTILIVSVASVDLGTLILGRWKSKRLNREYDHRIWLLIGDGESLL
jgi:hypothetical protein